MDLVGGAPRHAPLPIFAETQACPFIFAEKASDCLGPQVLSLFFLRSISATRLKIPESIPAYTLNTHFFHLPYILPLQDVTQSHHYF